MKIQIIIFSWLLKCWENCNFDIFSIFFSFFFFLAFSAFKFNKIEILILVWNSKNHFLDWNLEQNCNLYWIFNPIFIFVFDFDCLEKIFSSILIMYTQCAFPPRLIEFSSPFFATRRAKIWRRPGHLSNCTFWTFFVFSDAESVCTDCIGVSPPWLLYLCIAFGILFLVMLIINVFLCSAMTCSCARTDTMEKEPSIIEEFDPYTRSWQGSQYGSRWEENHKLIIQKRDYFHFQRHCKMIEFSG